MLNTVVAVLSLAAVFVWEKNKNDIIGQNVFQRLTDWLWNPRVEQSGSAVMLKVTHPNALEVQGRKQKDDLRE